MGRAHWERSPWGTLSCSCMLFCSPGLSENPRGLASTQQPQLRNQRPRFNSELTICAQQLRSGLKQEFRMWLIFCDMLASVTVLSDLAPDFGKVRTPRSTEKKAKDLLESRPSCLSFKTHRISFCQKLGLILFQESHIKMYLTKTKRFPHGFERQ